MRRPLLALAVGLLALLTVPLRAADDLVYVRFADYVESLRQQIGIPGLSAAIVGRTDVVWEGGFGFQDMAQGIRMRADTPMHVDGLTQLLSATTILRCSEENRLSLDSPMSAFTNDAPEPDATVRQLLSHTVGTGPSIAFSYRPARLDALAAAVKACEGDSYRETIANLLERLAMVNSVPGPDVVSLVPPAEGIPSDAERAGYARVLTRLATPYAVDGSKRFYESQYSSATLTPSTGLISTVRDFAQFDLALRGGVLLKPETLAAAWRPPVDATGKPLPHGMGWFAQTYNADTVVWQFGSGTDAGSSSMIVTLPGRGVTLLLFANSTGLVKSFSLEKGDVTASPFARIFLSLFTR
jgi:CubicO group peptidase (beta-lactamase class C family)